jgi:hypothetical protein
MIAATIIFALIYSFLQVFLLKDTMGAVVDMKSGTLKAGALMEYSFALEHYVTPLYIWLAGVIAVFFTVLSYFRLKYEEKA